MFGIHHYIIRHLIFVSLGGATFVYANDPMAHLPTTPKCQPCMELFETGVRYRRNGIRSIDYVVSWEDCRKYCTLGE